MNSDTISKVIMFVVIIPAIVFHEVAHGYVAYLLGDTTAKDRGRLSLNPLKHVDPFGTILLPLLMVAMFGFGFGYAKPVPINPNRFKDYRKGMLITGLAGPTANLSLAIVSGLLSRGVTLIGGSGAVAYYVWLALYYFCFMNLVLMFFNLIPLPPLDGSRVLPMFLSDRAMRTYAQVERYGFVILFGILWLAPRYLGFDPIRAYMNVTAIPLIRLLAG